MIRWGHIRQAIASLVTRRALGAAPAATKWGLDGRAAAGVDGADNQDDVAVCHGVGRIALPADPSRVEAIVVHVGGDADHPVCVGLIDPAIVATAVAIGIMAGDVLEANGEVKIHIRGGEVRIATHGSDGEALATLSDIDALRVWATAHTHQTVPPGPILTSPPLVAPPLASGTSVLKAE